jgi:predicted aspartyl protease
MKLHLENGLLLTQAQIVHNNQNIEFKRVLVDTGSTGTVFSRRQLRACGLDVHISDTYSRILGIGGAEGVFLKCFDAVLCGQFRIEKFLGQVSFMDYGVELDAILGLDFLCAVGAILDLKNLELRGE